MGFFEKSKTLKKLRFSYRHELVCSDLGAEFNFAPKSLHTSSWRQEKRCFLKGFCFFKNVKNHIFHIQITEVAKNTCFCAFFECEKPVF